ncbi:HRDC domain-containing protein, partial [Clostridioides difficile]
NISVSKYHAGLSKNERSKNQEDFINDNVDIMVATNAFGMGIDKPNIRWVIHYNMPQSIENYYQEIGRAGRDGEKSECVLLFSPGDVHIQKYLIDIGVENPERKLFQHKKLQYMIDLVYSNSCYRKTILSYFGENYIDNCNNCSNCLVEGEIVDKTIDAQKVISCVARMKRSYGVTTIVDVLRGSKNKKILQLGLNTLSTYNIMRDYSSEDLKNFVNTLVSHGFLDLVETLGNGNRGSFPTIRLNEMSMKVLKGEVKVEFKEIVMTKSLEVEDELYNALRELRHSIASEERIAPYMVFGDGTLRAMSSSYPINKEEMLDISGVGEIKYQKYGRDFEAVIKEYVEKII